MGGLGGSDSEQGTYIPIPKNERIYRLILHNTSSQFNICIKTNWWLMLKRKVPHRTYMLWDFKTSHPLLTKSVTNDNERDEFVNWIGCKLI